MFVHIRVFPDQEVTMAKMDHKDPSELLVLA